MTERSDVVEGLQIGVESTPGTAVAANRKIRFWDARPQLQTESESRRPMGIKWPVAEVPTREWVQWQVESNAVDYTDITYLLASLLTNPVSAQIAATSGYTHTFTPAVGALDAPRTLTIEQGQAARAHRAAFGMCTELVLEISRTGVSLRGQLVSRALEDDFTLTGSPLDLAERPTLPNEWSIYSDTTSAGLGGTKLGRIISARITLGNRFSPVWAIDAAESSWADRVEAVPTGEVELMLAMDASAGTLLADLRNRVRKFWRFDGQGGTDSIEAGADYVFAIDGAFDVRNFQEIGEDNGLVVGRCTLGLATDTTWGKAIEIALNNTLVDVS